ncbi:hypothetical protein [Roseimaritima sediminicola]|uniref:hypothetical protein n=1 Tax=Roseimaritima sediminicola TaxID=2662066 RepID=UPI0012982964|nr:hypothetical protein [Roseimaritima sediminicola]
MIRLVLTMAALLQLQCLASAQERPPTLSLEEIAERAEAQIAKLAEVKASYEVSWRQIPDEPFPVESEADISLDPYRVETAVAGDKRKSSITRGAFQEVASTTRTSFDGVYSLCLEGDMGSLAEGKDRMCEDVFYITEFLHKPITDSALRKEEDFFPNYLFSKKFPYSVLDAQEKIDGHWCHVVQSDLSKLWIDPNIGCLPRRIERVANPESDHRVLFSVHSMDDFREVSPGVYFPFDNTRVSYASLRNPKSYWDQPYLELSVKVLSANNDVDDSDFAMHALPGTLIASGDTQFTVPGDKPLILNQFGHLAGDEASYQPGYRRWRGTFIAANVVAIFVTCTYFFWQRRKTQAT